MNSKLLKISITLTIALVLISAHIGIRIYLIHDVLSGSVEKERMELIPKNVCFSAEKYNDLNFVNLGYCTFSSPIDFELSTLDKVVIRGKTDLIQLIVGPPAQEAPHLADIIAGQVKNLNDLPSYHPWREIIGKDSDTGLDILSRIEHAKSQPLNKVMLMGKSEFNAYLYQIRTKVWVCNKASETIEYSTALSRGFIHVQQVDSEQTRVRCVAESMAKDVYVSIEFILSGEMANSVIETIEPILATLTFDSEINWDDKEMIATKIQNAGIVASTK